MRLLRRRINKFLVVNIPSGPNSDIFLLCGYFTGTNAHISPLSYKEKIYIIEYDSGNKLVLSVDIIKSNERDKSIPLVDVSLKKDISIHIFLGQTCPCHEKKCKCILQVQKWNGAPLHFVSVAEVI